MQPERWQKIEELYHSALRLDPGQRLAFVRNECGGDETLVREVESLLAEAQDEDTFLETPAILLAEDANGTVELGAGVHPQSPFRTPSQIGRYRIVRTLGEGGMGIVYEAEQDQPRRGVALKIIKPGFATAQGVKRFEYESKALGRLQHPGIAQIYEAGTADTGFGQQPYFAMELIRGQSLTRYVESHRLDLRQRLALTVKICEAIHHAHERGLVHRDLKPGNILVDETGQPKVLDFGVAHVTESDTQVTRQTDIGQIIGTLAYMSPEQVLAEPSGVDARSDVYSLGVILYELLSGRLPHKVSETQLHEAMQAILNQEPAMLGALNRQYRGDIEVIVGKALEKDRSRRYASADDLAADIKRYLNDEPITARPPSATYQFQKFTRRHRGLVIGTLAVFVSLTLGIIVSLQQAIRAGKAQQAALVERDRATSEARTAEAVQKFIEDIFNTNSNNQSDPVKARQTTARQLLDIGAHNVATELDNTPAAKERMLGILSELYYGLGLSDEAVALDRKRVAAAKLAFGPDDSRVAAALSSLGSSMHASRSVNEREQVLLEAKAILDRNRDFTSVTRGQLLNALCEHYQSTDKRKALDYASQAVALYRKLPAGSGLAGALYQLGQILNTADDQPGAVAALSEAVEIARKSTPPDPSLPMYAATLGESSAQLMRYELARRNLELAAETARALNGEEHVDTFETEARLGDFFSQVAQYREAIAHAKHARDVCLKMKGIDDPFYTPQMSIIYGRMLALTGRLEDGLAVIGPAIENRRKNRPGTRYLAQMLSTEAWVLADVADYDKARRNLDEADRISKSVGFTNGTDYTSARLKIAYARHDLQTAAAVIESAYGPLPDHDVLSLALLRNLLTRAELALARDDPASAATLAQRAYGIVTASDMRPYLRYWELRALLDRGTASLGLHRASEALPYLQRASKLASDMYDSASVQRIPPLAELGTAFAQLGDQASAAKCLTEAMAIRKLHRRLGEQYERPLRVLRQSF